MGVCFSALIINFVEGLMVHGWGVEDVVSRENTRVQRRRGNLAAMKTERVYVDPVLAGRWAPVNTFPRARLRQREREVYILSRVVVQLGLEHYSIRCNENDEENSPCAL